MEKEKGSNPNWREKKGRFKIDEGKGGRGGKLEVSAGKGDTLVLRDGNPTFTPAKQAVTVR